MKRKLRFFQFKNAGQDKKDNFVNVIKEATAVLDNKDATEKEVAAKVVNELKAVHII